MKTSVFILMICATSFAWAEDKVDKNEAFSTFLETKTPVANLYSILYSSGFMLGLPSSGGEICPTQYISALDKLYGSQSQWGELKLIQLICHVQNGMKAQASEDIKKLLSIQMVSLRDVAFDCEYIKAALGQAPLPTDILLITQISADRPEVNYAKIFEVLQTGRKNKFLSDGNLVDIGKQLELRATVKEAKMPLEIVALFLGLKLQKEGYQPCMAEEPCKSNFRLAEKKRVELMSELTELQAANDQIEKSFFFPPDNKWWNQIQLEIIRRIPMLQEKFKDKVLKTGAGAHYGTCFQWSK